MRVVTGNLPLVPSLIHCGMEVVVLGGAVRPISMGVIGPYAEMVLRHLTVDKAFLGADGVVRQIEGIDVPNMVMMHDFNITENYVIFMDLPAVFNLELALEGKMPIEWSDSYPARLGVMPRNGNDSQVKWYDINPCYVFHPMNSYEDGDKIVLDVARFEHIWKKDAWRVVLPTSSMSPVRTHFCTLTARSYGGTAWPRKYGLNGTMPALTNSRVGSFCGTSGADGVTA